MVTSDGKRIIRRIHGIEMLRFQGWDLTFFRDDNPFFDESQTPELFSSLAGNMWTIFHFAPLHTAAYGCVDWSVAQTMNQDALDRMAKEQKSLAQASSDDDDSSASSVASD